MLEKFSLILKFKLVISFQKYELFLTPQTFQVIIFNKDKSDLTIK
jgi:hypothetical protein